MLSFRGTGLTLGTCTSDLSGKIFSGSLCWLRGICSLMTDLTLDCRPFAGWEEETWAVQTATCSWCSGFPVKAWLCSWFLLWAPSRSGMEVALLHGDRVYSCLQQGWPIQRPHSNVWWLCLTLWNLLLATLVVIHETLAILEFTSLGTAIIKLRG